MAYQKAKHVEVAHKFLHQGKIAQAVTEYQIILRHEPKDQITLMTVGDLLVRQGETFQALEYFERLAQIYLADGFLTKAIAIYKKITKLAPEEMRPVERLADLYVQQGVMSEARTIYLQMADVHQRANRPAQAVGLLRKLLDAEPDNARVQSRLADLLVASGQKSEAAAALRAAAQQLLSRGDNAEAIQFAERALKIEPSDEAALTLRARALVATGKQSDALGML
jgi:pilus assembly protein FimV